MKCSKGSSIVEGAAGNMDNMLTVVVKFVEVRLLVTGRVLTFVVLFLLPLMMVMG